VTRTVRLATLALLVAALPAAAEDMTFVQKSQKNQDPPQTGTTYVSSDKMRMSTPEGSDMIIDLAAGSLTSIDHKKKQYWVMTAAEMEAQAKQAEAAMKQAEEQMKSLPPAMRDKMQAMMGGGMFGDFKVEKGEGGRTVAGYACQNWLVTMGESMRQESCVTQQIQWPAQAYEGFRRFYGRLPGPMAKGMQHMMDEFQKMQGVPIATKMTLKMMGRTEVTTTELVELKKGPIPADVWAVPAGYKQVKSGK